MVDSVRVTKMLEQVETLDPELKHLMGLSNLALESEFVAAISIDQDA